MNDIEKDIKRCEKLTEPQNANWIGISNQLAIAGALARIKELEEENKLLLNSKVGIDLSYDDYISKQKVKDKIKELKKEYEIALEENSTKAFILKCKITALEELLEEK